MSLARACAKCARLLTASLDLPPGPAPGMPSALGGVFQHEGAGPRRDLPWPGLLSILKRLTGEALHAMLSALLAAPPCGEILRVGLCQMQRCLSQLLCRAYHRRSVQLALVKVLVVEGGDIVRILHSMMHDGPNLITGPPVQEDPVRCKELQARPHGERPALHLPGTCRADCLLGAVHVVPVGLQICDGFCELSVHIVAGVKALHFDRLHDDELDGAVI
mmetsp:Transcript_100088/g.238543  ORF Transcript_100088/g.238543 Transcript_100088/m.238543 type:complete len:219 (-) Transcript_100088:491-1147(-)